MEKVDCNLCGTGNHRLVTEISDQKVEIGRKFKIVECSNCGLIFTNPRPTKMEIKTYYTNDYYQSWNPIIMNDRVKTEKSSFVKSFHKLQGKLEQNKLFEKVKRVENNTGKRAKIIDVGCANGDFLAQMKSKGWQCLGIEISGLMSRFAKQKYRLHVFNGELEEANLLQNSVDVMTFWHSFEHLSDPMKVLRESYRILKQNGLIIILVPNIKSFEFMILKEKWPHLDVPRHMYHYSAKTLSNMLIKAEFKDIRLSYFTKLSINHLKLAIWPEYWDEIRLGRKGKAHSYVFCIKIMYELLHYISFPLSLIASLFRRGHSLVVYARKADE